MRAISAFKRAFALYFLFSIHSLDSTIVVATSTSPIWTALNTSVKGNLHKGVPFSLPCFSKYDSRPVSPDIQLCHEIQENYTSPTYRVPHFGAYMLPQWETCQSTGQECLLNSSNPFDTAAYNGSFQCSQGSVAPYHIDVRSASDIQHAFKFSVETGITISIKNSGHDYKGRSSSKASLSLWTHNLDSMSYNDKFIPIGCNTSYAAITVGAGVGWQDAYAFADQNNVTLVGAYHQTVGASGGWLMGGGHSILSPVFGLGVDRVVQIKIVTPDGEVRTANECQNADLFWALRGGGGGTFGVVLESTQRVEPKLTLQVAFLSFNRSSTNLKEFYSILLNNSLNWANDGWGGHIEGTSIIYVTPLLNIEEAKLSMEPAVKFIQEQNGTVVIETLPSWYSFFLKYVTAAEAAVGPSNILSTRLFPRSLFSTDSGKQQLLDLLLSITQFSLPYIPVVPPVLFNATEGTTSVTPAWRRALWHVSKTERSILGFHSSWPYSATPADIEGVYSLVHNFTLRMHAIAPNSGAYFNEGDVYEPNHTESYWGPNYPRLLEIKKKYDPFELLDCWQCVGWKGPSNPRYSCYLPAPAN